MNPQVQQAGQQLNPVYNQAQNQLTQQLPAIANLYQSLVQGLQGQQQAQVTNVVNSAAQRGVLSGQTQLNAQQALGQTLAQQTGQLGAQQAQDTAAAQLGIGKLNANRQSDIMNLANSLQSLSGIQQKAAMNRQASDRQYQLDSQKAQQDYNIQGQQYATAQARAAARAAAQQQAFDLTGVSKDQLTRVWREKFSTVKGGDGHVSPENLAKAYNDFTRAGLTPTDFWKAFQGNWDDKNKQYTDQFHYFVNKGV